MSDGRLARARIAADQLAPGGAVVVKAFGGLVENKADALAVVAIEAGEVQVVTEFRRVAGSRL